MSPAIAHLFVLIVMGYAADAVSVPWERPSPSYMPNEDVLEQAYERDQEANMQRNPVLPQTGYFTPGTDPAALQDANSEGIYFDSLSSGAVETVYVTPDKGRISMYFRNDRNDVLLVVDARFSWRGENHATVLNSKFEDGPWQKEVRPDGYPYPCCGYVTRVTLRVELTEEAFIVSANGIEIVEYPYREGLSPPLTNAEYVFQDNDASHKAKLESLSVIY